MGIVTLKPSVKLYYNFHQYATLTRPNKAETAVCGSLVAINRTSVPLARNQFVHVDLVRFGVIIQ